jgi:hypothetical protein
MPAVIASRGLSKCHLPAVDEDLARRGLVHPRHRLDEGRLARAVVAEQAVAFPRLHVERDPAEGDHRPEVLLDVAHLDQRHQRSPVIMRRM